jgi:hypothetical protein
VSTPTSTPDATQVSAGQTAEERWFQGVDRLRDVTKWLITAFAATGGVLVGTAPLTGLGQVTDRWPAVVFGAAVALGGIAWAIQHASEVLVPEYTTMRELQASQNLRSLREGLLSEEPTAFFGPWGKDLAEFRTRREQEWAVLEELETTLPQPDWNDEQRQALTLAQQAQRSQVAEIEEYARQLYALGTYFEVLERFRGARTQMLIGALLAAVAVGIFAWGVNAKGSDGAGESTKASATATVPRLAILSLTDDGVKVLGSQLGASCGTKSVSVVIVEGTAPPYTVVALPKNGCRAVQFILQANMGTFTDDVAVTTTTR